MFTIRKPKAEKILTGKARFSCSDNILSYPPFYPLLRLLLRSLLLFLMQWPKPMITRLLLPSPKTTSLLQLIDPYRREENASSSSSWHSSDKYWGLENRKSCPILEVLINFLGTASHSEIPIVFLTSFGDYLSLHIPSSKSSDEKMLFFSCVIIVANSLNCMYALGKNSRIYRNEL